MRAVAIAAYAFFVLAPFTSAFAAETDSPAKPFLAPDAVADNILTRKAAYLAVKKSPGLGDPVAEALQVADRRDMSERALVALVFEGDDW